VIWLTNRGVRQPLQNRRICHAASNLAYMYFLNLQHQVVHHCLSWSFAMARTTCTSCNLLDKTIQHYSSFLGISNGRQCYPILHRLAKKYLSVPATSASVEGLFTVARAIIRARRSSLAAATVESLLLRSELSS